jgi:hypothetical protein
LLTKNGPLGQWNAKGEGKENKNMAKTLRKSNSSALIATSIFLAITFLPTAYSYGDTYYVRKNGNNSNSGGGPKTNEAWQTVNYAVGQLSAGDILYIMDDDGGTYYDNVQISSNTNNGTATNRITVQPQPGDTIIIDGQNSDEALEINYGRRFWTFKDLTFRRGAGRNVILWDGDYIRFENCTFEDSTVGPGSPVGIHIWGNSDHNILYNCTMRNNAGEGVYIGAGPNDWPPDGAPSNHNEILRCEIYGNGSDGIDIKMGARYNTVGNSTIYSVGMHGIVCEEETTVEGNLIYDTGSSAIRVGRNNNVRNNMIYNAGTNRTYENHSGGIEIDGEEAWYQGNKETGFGNKIFHNTLYGSHNNLWLENSSDVENNTIKYNIFKEAVDNEIKTDSVIGSGNDIDYNLIHHTFHVTDLISYNKQNKSFFEWQAMGYDLNSINLDPELVSPPYNLHLQSSSPSVDYGPGVGVNHDYDGNPRPLLSGYDIGADEYRGDDPDPPDPPKGLIIIK